MPSESRPSARPPQSGVLGRVSCHPRRAARRASPIGALTAGARVAPGEVPLARCHDRAGPTAGGCPGTDQAGRNPSGRSARADVGDPSRPRRSEGPEPSSHIRTPRCGCGALTTTSPARLACLRTPVAGAKGRGPATLTRRAAVVSSRRIWFHLREQSRLTLGASAEGQR